MPIIPAAIIALSMLYAGIAWLFFARSQSGRRQAGLLSWLCIPIFAVCISYVWFSFVEVDIAVRAVYARNGFFAIGISQGIILTMVSILNRGPHGPKH